MLTQSETTSDGNSTLYRLTIGAAVTITLDQPLGNDLTTPPSTQEGFTGGLADVPVGTPGPGSLLRGSLVGISGDGSGTTYLNTIRRGRHGRLRIRGLCAPPGRANQARPREISPTALTSSATIPTPKS